ncbi:1,4-alpha-glucan (glycogen) branching enzyme, GH-13-type [Labilithrix luteola]|uniref:1,4-alpha-glucan (Glycogen) branching enzyme, GH-13-type n=1 Tax=Labilithrix luteola TaxID=1391654 RepID=A0A0K1PX33_9BACT|nr:VOC family protein [Labilithrix luteola]AKU98090.1 1,4-alpha-glucan (glycogen) branching enzyme, GH-13-type [Labilithrix luteola]
MPNAFAHIELTTNDLPAAKKFYKSVFAWKLSDVKSPAPYTMIDVGTGVGGGMQAPPMPGAPTGWMPYVEVDDVKKTVAKAAKAGAKIMLDYHSIGDMGAIGVFTDPTGCIIGVWEAPKKAPAKKAGAKKAGAKKAGAKKAGAKKAGAKKAAAKPAKKAGAKKGR